MSERERIDREILEKITERIRLRDPEGADPATARAGLRRQAAELGLSSFHVERIFARIDQYAQHLTGHRRLAETHPDLKTARGVRVAFQGIRGAYSYLAVMKFFAGHESDVLPVGHGTMRDTVRAVQESEADFALLPIENTLAGSINETYELLARAQLSIVGEEILPIHHCLLAAEDVPLSRIQRICSHPVALAQCNLFLQSLAHCTVESVGDTAEAARRVREAADPTVAAIASEEAAELYGLTVVRREIENDRENYTRFVLVARQPLALTSGVPCKTSLLLVTAHEKGALLESLQSLAEAGINMTKLESRPIPGAPWEYMFYIDIEANAAETRVQEALDAMRRRARELRVLGTYPVRAAESAPTEGAGEDLADLVVAGGGEDDAAEASAASPAPQPDRPFRLASRASRPDGTVLRVKGAVVGEGFCIIAGPCAVESRDQILESARIVKETGGQILRGGAFKPRTSPYSFQGLGREGLEYLAEAGEKYELPVVSEVLTPEDVAVTARYVDILQVGARNMQNFALLREVGTAGKPVLLKRGMMSSVEEWLLAAEYILKQGNQQVILCERGLRSFDTATRNLLDVSAVPVARSWSHLPVFVDPSHAVGVREWIPDLAAASAAAGAHGIMVEIHPNPEEALCDRAQALPPEMFRRMVASLRRILAARGEGGAGA
jgi:chorismate mutase/prephenate dehydratase